MKKIILLFTGAILAMTTTANASTYRDVTEKIIHKTGTSWKWSDFQNIKQVKWEAKTPKSSTYNGQVIYYLKGTLGSPKNKIYWGMFDVDGNKSSPKSINLQAMDEQGEILPKIMPSLFDPANLAEIKSSCTRKKYNPQSFYKWSKKGYAPLYITQSSRYSGQFGTYHDVYIHQSFDEMVKNVNNSGDGPLLMNDDVERVDSCSFTKI